MSRITSWKSRAALLLVVGILVLPLAMIQAQNTLSDAAKAARNLYRAQEWEKAAAAYEKVMADEPGLGIGWVHLGISYHNLKQYRKAAEAGQRAVDIGFAQAVAGYNVASAYALLGEADKSFSALDKAIAAGYGNAAQLEADNDFAALRDDARYAAALQQTKVTGAPCEYIAEYKQFDFWIGEWDVFGAGGTQVGQNTIERLDKGCVLWENWTSASGTTGHSINYYDHTIGKYIQLWVSANGGIIRTEGSYEDGAMRMTGELMPRTGKRQPYRGTWTLLEDGRVQQLLEVSNDGGKTWTTWFNGFYKRKTKATE